MAWNELHIYRRQMLNGYNLPQRYLEGEGEELVPPKSAGETW